MTSTFPFSLVATDLDGTFMRSDRSISDRSKRIVSRLTDLGVVFVMVTARPPRVLKEIADRYNFSGLAICCNGAIIYNIATDEILQHNPVPHEEAVEIAHTLRSALPDVTFAWERGHNFGCEPRFASLHTFVTDQPMSQGELSSLEISPFTKLIALDPNHQPDTLIEIARAHAGPNVSITHSGAPFIEISAKGVDKSTMLRTLANELSIPLERTIAFGDMPNDLQMLNLAGHSVAPSNAHPTVLRQAKEITLSNDQDGVAAVLERLLQTGR